MPPSNQEGVTLIPTWVFQSADIPLDQFCVLAAICAQRQAFQDRSLASMTPYRPARVKEIISILLGRGLVVQGEAGLVVPVVRPR